MANTVLTVSPTVIQSMKTTYTPYLQAKIPPGGVFVAKPDGCTITAYRSGKVLFQGQKAEDEAAKWGEAPKGTLIEKKKAMLPERIAEMSLIGSDEVGTGDYFGPMVVCAAFVSKQDIQRLKALGVRDSKHLKDPQIIDIAKALVEETPHSALVLPNEKYNELQAKGMSQGKMKALLHNKVINNVANKIDSTNLDGILIDQFAEPGVYYNYLKGQKNIVKDKVYFSTKAEEVHVSVACASIIARFTFLKEWEKLNDIAGFPIPKGAGAHVDKAAARVLTEQGMETLKRITKYHFANTEKAKKLM